ncbi:MAG TPA: hypothetical protein VHV82_21605 [Sporichthyaceae bacterium]|nr:hypothetical protein [Sporichthyaceae bacterium]
MSRQVFVDAQLAAQQLHDVKDRAAQEYVQELHAPATATPATAPTVSDTSQDLATLSSQNRSSHGRRRPRMPRRKG